MDLRSLAFKIGIAEIPAVVRKAQEIQRLSKVRFDATSLGLGEICKSVMCLEIASSQLQISVDRIKAIRISGLSEKAYVRSLSNLQNALGLKLSIDVRELAIQFGCIRLISHVQKALGQYKIRFVQSLPATRKSTADFNRPVFIAVAFYLCARRNKLKVDKTRLIEICGTSESEFTKISSSMLDLCFDLVGLEKEKKEPVRSTPKKASAANATPKKSQQRSPVKRNEVDTRASQNDPESNEESSELANLLKMSRSAPENETDNRSLSETVTSQNEAESDDESLQLANLLNASRSSPSSVSGRRKPIECEASISDPESEDESSQLDYLLKRSRSTCENVSSKRKRVEVGFQNEYDSEDENAQLACLIKRSRSTYNVC